MASSTPKYKTLKDSQVSFTLNISKEDMQKSQKKVVARFSQSVSVKGFRKGHAPESRVVASVGIQKIAEETFSEALDAQYSAFLSEAKLQPISQPKINVKDPNATPVEVSVELEIYPEIALGAYDKISVGKISIPKISEKEVSDVLESIMVDMKIGKSVSRAAKNNDLLEVSFRGKDKKGETIPRTEALKTFFRIGKGNYLPDLEKAMEGMKSGEKKDTVAVKFPKDYFNKEMAGKSIDFEVEVHQVLEVSAKNLTEEDIQKISGKKQSLTDFELHIKNYLEQNKKSSERKELEQKYRESLAKVVKGDLPQSWIESEVAGRMEELKNSPEYKANPEAFWARNKSSEEAMKKEFAQTGEKGLRVFLGLSKIVEKEKIELDKDEKTFAETQAHESIKSGRMRNFDYALERENLNIKIEKYLSSLFA